MKEYFCGRIIYSDPDGHKLWCIHCGDKTYRFTSLADAETWAAEEAKVIINEHVKDLQLTQLRLQSAYTAIDDLAERNFHDKGLLQLVSLQVRQAADRLDKYIITISTPPR